MRKKERKTKPISIRGKMLVMVVGCWLIPFFMMTALVCIYLGGGGSNNYRERLKKQMDYDMGIYTERLNYIIGLSRSASYEGRIAEIYSDYRMGKTEITMMLNELRSYLYGRYSNDAAIQNAILWFWEDAEHLRGFAYNTKSGGQYGQIGEFWGKDYGTVSREAQGLKNGVKFVCLNNHYYLLRNVMNSRNQPIATLALRVNEKYCMESLLRFSEDGQIRLVLDDEIQIELQDGKVQRVQGDGFVYTKDGSYWKNGKLYIQKQQKEREYQVGITAILDGKNVLKPVYGYLYVLAGMTVLLIPILLVMFRTVKKNILEPLHNLMYGSKQVSIGNFGYHLNYKPGNKEFAYLTESFNDMSERLKYQFDHIYKKELALRDARIMALQSHINPHFMNNTLEMINWMALLEGSKKVPPMIRSLSELMNAAMDRKKKPIVPLAEELRYVQAYLDIMSVRLGSGLTVMNEVKEEHQKVTVPRMILQPLIENAIEHGVIPNGHGTVWIRSEIEEEYLYLEILNEGTLTSESEKKVELLLSPEYDTSKAEGGNMGIANVNQRLRILYGDECGLKIFDTKAGQVCAQVRIAIGSIAQK